MELSKQLYLSSFDCPRPVDGFIKWLVLQGTRARNRGATVFAAGIFAFALASEATGTVDREALDVLDNEQAFGERPPSSRRERRLRDAVERLIEQASNKGIICRELHDVLTSYVSSSKYFAAIVGHLVSEAVSAAVVDEAAVSGDKPEWFPTTIPTGFLPHEPLAKYLRAVLYHNVPALAEHRIVETALSDVDGGNCSGARGNFQRHLSALSLAGVEVDSPLFAFVLGTLVHAQLGSRLAKHVFRPANTILEMHKQLRQGRLLPTPLPVREYIARQFDAPKLNRELDAVTAAYRQLAVLQSTSFADSALAELCLDCIFIRWRKVPPPFLSSRAMRSRFLAGIYEAARSGDRLRLTERASWLALLAPGSFAACNILCDAEKRSILLPFGPLLAYRLGFYTEDALTAWREKNIQSFTLENIEAARNWIRLRNSGVIGDAERLYNQMLDSDLEEFARGVKRNSKPARAARVKNARSKSKRSALEAAFADVEKYLGRRFKRAFTNEVIELKRIGVPKRGSSIRKTRVTAKNPEGRFVIVEVTADGQQPREAALSPISILTYIEKGGYIPIAE